MAELSYALMRKRGYDKTRTLFASTTSADCQVVNEFEDFVRKVKKKRRNPPILSFEVNDILEFFLTYFLSYLPSGKTRLR